MYLFFTGPTGWIGADVVKELIAHGLGRSDTSAVTLS